VRFSSRLDWSSPPNALARAVEARRAAGRELYDLTESNPTAAGIPYPAGEILSALADPRALTYQPTPRGLDEARRAVAGYYRERGLAVDAEHLLLTASTSEAYALLFKLLCDPGDRVAVPQPSYPLFDFLAALESVQLHPYRLSYHDGWFLDGAELERALAPPTRALLVVHPNNPTGSFLKRGERERLVALCAERGCALIVDEVFGDYPLANPAAPSPAAGWREDDKSRAASDRTSERVASLVDEQRVPTFVLSGLSKVVGLPQLKLGWIHVGGPERALALERLELVADTYLSVGAPVQHAAARLLALKATVGAAIVARVRANHARARGAVAGRALELLDAEGGWYACLRLPRTRSEEAWALALLDHGVLAQPGWFFDFPDEPYLVVSLLTDEVVFAEGMARLVALAG
jgi:aspartate/methionine/tyrosine aminotransferase